MKVFGLSPETFISLRIPDTSLKLSGESQMKSFNFKGNKLEHISYCNTLTPKKN